MRFWAPIRWSQLRPRTHRKFARAIRHMLKITQFKKGSAALSVHAPQLLFLHTDVRSTSWSSYPHPWARQHYCSSLVEQVFWEGGKDCIQSTHLSPAGANKQPQKNMKKLFSNGGSILHCWISNTWCPISTTQFGRNIGGQGDWSLCT